MINAITEIEHKGDKYWLLIEPITSGKTKQLYYIAFVSKAANEPVEVKKDFGAKYKEFLRYYQREWCIQKGTTAKNGQGVILFFPNKASALTNGKMLIRTNY